VDNVPIWKYLTLAKYIDLLRTRSLYFAKASRFNDETEGKWWGHAHLYHNAQHWGQSPANKQTLEQLLARAGTDPAAILREINQTLPSANQWVGNILRTALRVYPDKRREYLESVISSWKKQYSDHNVSVTQWKSDLNVYRESTYISCWNGASSMSLAMWEMYGGTEAVAVRSTSDKLQAIIQLNSTLLEKHGLIGTLAEVEYVDGLKNPDEEVQECIYQIMFERDRDLNVGLFAIKPSVYDFEHEVRAILYAKRELVAPLEDPHPNMSGFSLPFNPEVDDTRSIADFIETVYVHPMLEEDSLVVHSVSEINKRFDAAEIRVVADRIEALGSDVTLPESL
jgi:hypothetical protein